MVWDRGYWNCDDAERAYGKGKLDYTLVPTFHKA
jgi:bifunctional non-homologous end joining protein LigD